MGNYYGFYYIFDQQMHALWAQETTFKNFQKLLTNLKLFNSSI